MDMQDQGTLTNLHSPISPSLSSSPRKKASPSDVIFGQPPGTDEVSRVYGTLSSDGTIGSGNNMDAPYESFEGSLGNQVSAPGSGSGGSEPTMEIDRPESSSFHATPSTPATTVHTVPDTSDGDQIKTLPASFEDSDPEDVVVLVADMLMRLTVHNDMLPLHPSSLTRFHSRAAPSISVLSYLKRIAKYTSLEKSCTLILLVYIDRVCQRIAGFTICSLTVHRFVCAAVVCASKALCDSFSTNGHYARVGGISLVELNMLEKEFLDVIDWKLSCSGALLQHYYTSLVRSHSHYRLESN